MKLSAREINWLALHLLAEMPAAAEPKSKKAALRRADRLIDQIDRDDLDDLDDPPDLGD